MSAPRTTLVTGAHGLIGSWLVKALLARGDRVTIFERGREGRPSALCLEGTIREVARESGDIRDESRLREAIGAGGIDTVFHLAAASVVGAARADPAGAFDVNVTGTLAVLEACRVHDVEALVCASTHLVYGPRSGAPRTEDDPLSPTHAYAATKAAADLLARSYWPAYGMPVAVTRLTNTYGGGDLLESRLVPDVILSVLAGERPQLRSDGRGFCELIHAADAASAYIAIEEQLRVGEAACGLAFNGGGGDARTVGEIAAQLCIAAGSALTPQPGELDAGHGERTNSARLRELTGWQPAVALEAGIAETVEWYRRYMGMDEGLAFRRRVGNAEALRG